MHSFLLILKNEWRILKRGRALKILTLLALASGIYALVYGTTLVRRQQETLATLRQDEHERLDSLAAWAGLDTTTVDHKKKWAIATNAYYVNVPRGYRYALHDPSALTPLSLGMRDLFPYYQDVEGRAIFRQLFQQEISNPQKMLVGHFDWAFVVVFLLPLFMIVLSYNMLSSEKELGTFALLRSQPVTLRQVVLAKLLLRLALVFVFLVGITGLAAFTMELGGARNIGMLLKYLAIAVGYSLFWGAVVFAVVSFQKTSAFNALTLLGCWLVVVLVLPALLQQWLSVSQPMDRSRLENLVRDEYSQRQADSVVLKPYYARHPELYFPADTAPRELDLRAYYARNEQLDLTLAPLVEAYEQAMTAREATVSRMVWLLPAVNALDLFNGLAGTSAANHRDYLRQVRDFHGRWNSFFLPKVFKNELLRPADYEQFPAWSFQSLAPAFSISQGLLKLLLVSGLVFAMGWLRLK
ncbi:DUF3526 domain-containing protein [Rhabdobacter roseus]|uniref:ABC-2 type transport system permease protein n=1 Tax=Rhabdobacter roseus TaxID=1655419 RepID=A0A840TY66_9BACT|nr:DUF3526 domain-containing protein [Rhabdobacter roseus]MBB5286233.1 ABC-2 type transport system permease protein [Rhabdobacter roseus]